jgi:hypothetical protein
MLTVRQVTMPADCGAFDTLIFRLCLMAYTSLSEGLMVMSLYPVALGKSEILRFF